MPFPHRVSATSLAAFALLAAAPAFAGPAQGAECELNEVFRTGGQPNDAIIARDHAFVATHIGVEMLSLADPGAIAPAGSLTTLPATSLALLGDVLLVAVDQDGGEDALHLFDISAAPQTQALGAVSWPDGFDSAQHVAARGGLALVASGSLGALLIDVSDPEQPFILATIPPPGAGNVRRVALFDGAAALFLSNGTIATYHLGDPANPALLAQTPGSLAENLATQGDIVHTVNSSGFTTLDFADPAAPAVMSTLPITNISDIDRAGDIVFIGDRTDGSLIRIDVSDPAAPFVIDGCCPADGLAHLALIVASSPDRTVIVMQRAVRLIDTSSGASVLIGEEPRLIAPRGLAVEGGLVLIATSTGAHMASLHADGSIDGLGAFWFPWIAPPASTQAAALRGDRAFTFYRSVNPQTGHILLMLDISDPMLPTLTGAILMPGTSSALDAAYRFELIENTLYVRGVYAPWGGQHIRAFDASSPTLQHLGDWPGSDIATRGHVLYVLQSTQNGQTLRAMDGLQPLRLPQLGSSALLPEYSSDWLMLRIDGARAYLVTANGDAIATLDISDATDIQLLGIAEIPEDPAALFQSVRAIQVHESVAYLAQLSNVGGHETTMLSAFDLSNPSVAVRLAHRPAPWTDPEMPATAKTPTGILFDGYHMAFVTCPCPADLNGDGFVGMTDLMLVVDAFNTTPSDPNYNPAADTNGDNVIDFADLNLVLAAFNTPC